MSLRSVVCIACLVGATTGCGPPTASDAGPASDANDAGDAGNADVTSETSDASPASDGGTCNTLGASPASLPVVTNQLTTSAEPAPTGGVIADGHYVLSQVTDYGATTTGHGSSMYVGEILVATGMLELFLSAGDPDDIDYNATTMASGSMLTGTVTCVGPHHYFLATPDHFAGFDATPTRLSLHVHANGGAEVVAFMHL